MNKSIKSLVILILSMGLILNCQPKQKKQVNQKMAKGTFGYDAEFLSKHQHTIILKKNQASLAICPGYQGRVMTSSAKGNEGLSYGWLNYNLIESGEILKHINPVGGEDRFWLGPEGGQFSIFFKEGDQFSLDDWQTPASIDTDTYDVVAKNEKSVFFEKKFEIENFSKEILHIGVKREISFIEEAQIPQVILKEEALNYVAYQSINEIINRGESPWTKQTGTVSIWILGMFNPSPNTTIFIPFKEGQESELGPIVNDEYFGKVPAERLVIENGMIYFKGDGQERGKIGLSPKRALSVMGSFDEDHGVLTIVKYSEHEGVTDYVNSMWELQKEPFKGDVVNSYNDGPVDGNALGPFYELETSSPAAFLLPGESMRHIHQTYHIQGTDEQLNQVTEGVFNVNLQTIKNIF